MFKDIVQLCSSIPRLKLLKFFLFQPDVRITTLVATNTTGVPKAVTMRELRALKNYGILTSRTQGKNTVWSLNTSHPFTVPFRAFLDSVTLPEDSSIASAFRGVSGITLLVVAGVLTGEERGVIDILIVTKKPNNPRIATSVRTVERMSALPLRYAVLEKEEYAERLEARDRMLRDVLEFKHRTIIGRR